MKTYKIKLVNDNGAKTGCGSMSIEVRATDREIARVAALRHALDNGSPESKWRLHDSERGK